MLMGPFFLLSSKARMRLGPSLLVATALVWSALVATVAARPQSPAAPRESSLSSAAVAPQSQPPTPSDAGAAGGPSGDYIGSAACKRCHEVEHGQWQRLAPHPDDQADRRGHRRRRFQRRATLADHGRSFEFGTADGKPFMRDRVRRPRRRRRSRVDYTLGAKRYQGYLSTMPDGRIYVLPVFWHIESRRWVDWKEITPIPDGAHDLRQIWNTNCFNCHGTNIAQGYDVATKQYNSTWTEMGIGCEACHGPGRQHVAI